MDAKPLWLLAELTYRCPLQCPYCSNPLDFAGSRFKQELTTEQWSRVFREAKALGVLQLGLSGGEPLLRPDLESLVASAHQLGLYTSLITSAHRLTQDRLAAAWRVVRGGRAGLGPRLEIVWVLPDYHEQFPKPCMGGWARAYMTVTPGGEVWPCHAAGRITTLTFDNVRDRSLDWIWHQSDAFNRFRGEAWMPEPCRSCPRKAVDFGGCRCQAFLVAGDASLTDPVCSLAPQRHVIDRAVAQVERAAGARAGPAAFTYSAAPASRALAAKG